MVFSRGGEREAEWRKWGFQGDGEKHWNLDRLSGFLHIADDCWLQIIFFVSTAVLPFTRKTMCKSVRLEGTIINLTCAWHIYSFACASVDESGQTAC